MADAGEKRTEIDVTTLSVQQLQNLQQQLEQELLALRSNYSALKMAEARFRASKDAVASISAEDRGKEMLVPLTPSVFVPGRLSTVDRVLVDVGTGFYVGKPTAAAAEILAKKESSVSKVTTNIANEIAGKEQALQGVMQVLTFRVQQAQSGAAATESG